MNWCIVTGDSTGLGAEIARSVLDGMELSVIGISRQERGEVLSLKKEYPEKWNGSREHRIGNEKY